MVFLVKLLILGAQQVGTGSWLTRGPFGISHIIKSCLSTFQGLAHRFLPSGDF